MTDILREVDEAMRQERMEKFWKENGQTLIIFVIATIVMTGMISGWRAWDASVKAKGTDKLLTLTEAPDFPANLETSKLNLRPGLRGIALINGAQDYLDAKKTKEAEDLYARIIDDGSIPGEIRGLAVLQMARISENAGDNDKLMKALDGITREGGNPWRFHAGIEAASFAAAKADYKKARDYLASVMDQKAMPDTLYKKARALDHVYALHEQDAEVTKNKAEEKEGT